MRRSSRGQSMVEYAIGVGCITALSMAVLGTLGFIDWRLLHNIEHALVPHGSGHATSGHAHAIVEASAQPWVID